jgi:hypothetical protein
MKKLFQWLIVYFCYPQPDFNNLRIEEEIS